MVLAVEVLGLHGGEGRRVLETQVPDPGQVVATTVGAEARGVCGCGEGSMVRGWGERVVGEGRRGGGRAVRRVGTGALDVSMRVVVIFVVGVGSRHGILPDPRKVSPTAVAAVRVVWEVSRGVRKGCGQSAVPLDLVGSVCEEVDVETGSRVRASS